MDAASAVRIGAEWLERVAGLPPSFLQEMKRDSDWMALIKWHAILEAAMNHAITAKLALPEAAKVFARMQMSDTKAGKMALVEACKLIPKQARVFIQKLSEMRNYAVHDVRNFGFTFAAYRDAIDPKERKAWCRQIAFYEPAAEQVAACEKEPRAAISVGCTVILLMVFLRDVEHREDWMLLIDQELKRRGVSIPKE